MATLLKLSMAYQLTKIIRHLQFRYHIFFLFINSLEMRKFILQVVQALKDKYLSTTVTIHGSVCEEFCFDSSTLEERPIINTDINSH